MNDTLKSAKPGHTLILIQFTEDESTKTWLDYENTQAASSGLCGLYEQRLKLTHADVPSMSYDAAEMLAYFDNISDICAFTFNEETKMYDPHNKEWIKRQLLDWVREQAVAP